MERKQKSESKYVADWVKELKKNRGNDDIWKKKWEGAKSMIWNPKFLELVNVVMSKDKVDLRFLEESKSSKYTLIVSATWIYLEKVFK